MITDQEIKVKYPKIKEIGTSDNYLDGCETLTHCGVKQEGAYTKFFSGSQERLEDLYCAELDKYIREKTQEEGEYKLIWRMRPRIDWNTHVNYKKEGEDYYIEGDVFYIGKVISRILITKL